MSNSATATTEIKDPPKDFWGIVKSLGPGLIISASIVGSGELIVTTKLGADVGFTLLWFIFVGCLIKVFLQIEWGRYVLGTGKSTLTALQGIPGPRFGFSWMNWCWFAMFLATFFQVAGMLGSMGNLFIDIGFGWTSLGWASVVAAVCLILLVIGRYGMVEKASTIFVVLFTFFTVASVIGLSWTSYAISSSDLLEGFSFRLPDDYAIAFAAFGVIGVGASELLYYPYWCLEKGYARSLGRNDGSEAWNKRAKGWFKVLQCDAWASFAIYTISTAAFYILGATILHRQGLEVSDHQMISTLSKLYTEVFGPMGFWAFAVGAFAVLFSTVFISTASNTRLVANAAQIFKLRGSEDGRSWILGASIALPILYLILFVGVKEPVSMVLLGSIAQASMLPILTWALWFLQKEIPATLRGGKLWMFFLFISTLSCTILGVYKLIDTFN